MRPSPQRQTAIFTLAIAFISTLSRADFIPINLTTDSFNQDVVVEKTAPPPIVPVTTASMDSGITNTGFGWYERGYHALSPSTGLPSPGTIIQADGAPENTYQFAPSYKTNNAVLIDNTLTNAAFVLVSPTKVAQLSFLLAAGNGPGTIRTTILHQDSTTEIATNTCPDWMTIPGGVLPASGRVDVNQFIFDSVDSSYPTLFARNLTLSNTNSAVASIQFSYIGGASHIAIFAVSGSTNLVDPFTPLAVAGHNADLVVEASATRRESLATATSASMEGGTSNAGRTWYEQGYYPFDPGSGFPAAASFVTNTAADHVFPMPPSYITNNALMIDSELNIGSIQPATPGPYAALSFLCASGRGPVTNLCVIQHANGFSESNNLVIPDWFGASPGAFTANGDLNLTYRTVDSIGSNYPKLYSVDLLLANTTSPVTNVFLAFKDGPPNSHSAIFALGGLASQGTGIRPILSISRLPAGNLRVSTSQPGQLQSTTALNGPNTVWQNEGAISSTLDVAPASGPSTRFYRVIGQ